VEINLIYVKVFPVVQFVFANYTSLKSNLSDDHQHSSYFNSPALFAVIVCFHAFVFRIYG